ncbi:MAG: helix-turn-helix domain-containing protein [Acidimicrobiia bacterium]
MDVAERAKRHSALGDPVRLSIIDDLVASDRSPQELSQHHHLPSNLLAHHLDVLEAASLIERVTSSGDRRRRYVRLRHESLREIGVGATLPQGPVLFVCTHNSARSQLAAVVWEQETGTPAMSAGTHPADRVHPGAVLAASRSGLDLSSAVPRSLDEIGIEPAWVVTVCDRAHEELTPGDRWWHWSTPDPVAEPTAETFDMTLKRIRNRIRTLNREAEQ